MCVMMMMLVMDELRKLSLSALYRLRFLIYINIHWQFPTPATEGGGLVRGAFSAKVGSPHKQQGKSDACD
jgi:hypothetical protein